MTGEIERAALHYASCGLRVIPLNGKVPVTEHAYQDGTTNSAQIAGWFEKWPHANVGIVVGSVCVLDIDPRNGGDRELAKLGELPATLTVDTGGGGQHYYFKPDARATRKELVPGVELKPSGGYVVAPPSIHPATVKPYTWRGLEQLPAFDVAQLAALPEWVLALCGKPKQPAPSIPDMLTDGSRNNTLASIAGSMRRRGCSSEGILAALRAENAKRCAPPLDDDEVQGIAKSIGRYPAVVVAVEADAPDSRPKSMHPRPAGGYPWPAPPDRAAFAGLAGKWVRLLEPHTEADPVGLLVQFLTACGSSLGRGPHTQVESDRHGTNLFVAAVGATAKGRKGTTWGRVREQFEQVDPVWVSACVASGLSSGEGLIWAVRDAIWKDQPVRDKGHVVGYESVKQDAGVADKRLLVVETELASTLRVIGREGNTLSPVIRQAWDTGDLRSLTKNSPACATDAHISIVAHVTADELKRELTEIDMANGFANRFLWVAVRRSKALPEGGNLGLRALGDFASRLAKVLKTARQVGQVLRDEAARALWAERYFDLSAGQPGLLGAVTSRAEAQVTRLSLLYALLAGRSVIEVEDLEAALALWEYCERSARYIFGASVAESDDEQRQQQLVQVIAGRPERTVTVHWLANSSRQCYRGNRELAERDLMALEKQGLGVLRNPPSGPATGRLFVLRGAGLDADALDLAPRAEHPRPHPQSAPSEANWSAPDLERVTAEIERFLTGDES